MAVNKVELGLLRDVISRPEVDHFDPDDVGDNVINLFSYFLIVAETTEITAVSPLPVNMRII